MISNFIHLRVQSSYSMLESALTVDKLIELAKKNNMPALLLSDRGNLFGSLEFSLSATKSGIQPIHGSILNLLYKEEDKDKFAEILLIAKDKTGYQNLLKLVSYSFIKNERRVCNHITFEDLLQYHEGIIALSCYTEGLIGRALLNKDNKQARFWAKELQNIFKDRFYFEIMRHDLEKERIIEHDYLDLATELNIPLVATNNVLFADISMYEAHDILLCISAGVTKEHDERKRVSNQCYFKSAAQMAELFKDLPAAIENTIHLAQRCNIMSESSEPMLPRFSNDSGNEEDLLRHEAEKGLELRLNAKYRRENIPPEERSKILQQYMERLNYELEVICKMNFAGYFLIVSDFIKWSKQQNITVGPGRGSGAGSIVAWCLLITDLDPIKFGLLFERFLNPERISMPDFDIDFCQEKREEVINYVRSKYGDNRVGQIITFGKMQAKAVIKDVSRVLGLPYRYAEHLTELVPFNAVNPVTLAQAIEEVAELKQAASGKGLYNLPGEEELIKQVLEAALSLEGLNRHASIHAAGIVIAGKDLMEIVPVYKDTHSSMLVVQYSMKYAELAGLMKFDFLGLQTLTVITKCKELLSRRGININFDEIGYDDKKTYEMLSTGAGSGVFQFEGPGMRDTLRRLKPDSIGDLIALGALYRPGPMENIPVYIACKHELQKPDYLHPLLESILTETYGVIIYQEQVIEIAKVLAGYSLGSADLLRRAMGKKIKAEMAAQEELFVNGAKANNIPEEQAKSIFETVAKFAGYGFNKAHASAYAIISYQTAYLKANFPAEFLVACMNLDMDNNDKINLFIREAQNNNIKVLPPDINTCRGYFTVSFTHCHPELASGSYESDTRHAEKAITYALGAIKNVTAAFGEIVESEREQNGPFKSITDFVERLPLKSYNRKLLENLIKAGCFDKLHPNRNQLLLSVYPGSLEQWEEEQKTGEKSKKDSTTPKLLAYASSYHEERNSKQISLLSIKAFGSQIFFDVVPPNNIDLAFQEFHVLGLFVNRHPLTDYRDLLQMVNISDSKDLYEKLPFGSSTLSIAGVIQKKDARMSARGKFITLQLSDQYGIFDLTIFSEEILRNYGHLLDIKTLVVASCDVFKDNGGYRLTAKSFKAIDDLLKDNKLHLTLYPKNGEQLKEIIDLLKNKRQSSENSNASISLMLDIVGSFIAKVVMPDSFSLTTLDINNLKQYYYD